MADGNVKGFRRRNGLDAHGEGQDQELGALVVVGENGGAVETTDTGLVDAGIANRFAGGKLTKTIQVTAAGDTTLLAAGAAEVITLYWVSAISDIDATQSPRLRVGYEGAADYLYSAYAIAHWEKFSGATGADLIMNMDQTGDVAVTLHYTIA